jgi:mono/diheme cytochrome c family protein
MIAVLALVGVASAMTYRWVTGPSGADLYAQQCAGCHGPVGGRIPAAPLDSPAFLTRRGAASLYDTIAAGKGTMAALGKEHGGPLSDAEIKMLVAFLLSTERAGPGRTIFQTQCASCHGEQGSRIPAALLNSRQVLDRKSDEELAQAIALGKGAMPAFGAARGGPLREEEVAAVVDYVRLLAGSTAPETRNVAASPAVAPRTSTTTGAAASQAAPDRGRELFSQNCAGCHASLSLPQMPPAQVEATIADGVASKGMPAFRSRLSQEDIAALAQLVVAGAPASGATAGGGGVGSNPYAGILRHVDGWITRHPVVVKESGTQLCSRCHQPNFCVTCHTGGRISP